MITIGLFGPEADAEVSVLGERLRSRGVRTWAVDLARFPQTTRLSHDAEGVRVDGRPLLEMDAAYLRRVGTALPALVSYDDGHDLDHDAVAGPRMAAVDRAAWGAQRGPTVAALQRERSALAVRTAVLVELAAMRPIVNPPRQQNFHRLKTWLLSSLQGRGVPVPELCSGTASARLMRFAELGRERFGGVVDKPLAGIYKTRLWRAERGARHRWGRRPALYQRQVPGETIRCYALAGRVLTAARIVHGSTVDSSLSQTGIDPVELSSAERRIVERVVDVLCLAFCGLDLLRDQETGETFVIDCNLSPMFVNYGHLSGCDVAGQLADQLIALGNRRGDYQRPRPSAWVDEVKDLICHDPDIVARLRDDGDERGRR